LSMDWLTKPVTFNKDNDYTAIVEQGDAARLILESPKGFKIIDSYHDEEDIHDIIERVSWKYRDKKMRKVDIYREVLTEAGVEFSPTEHLKTLKNRIDKLKGVGIEDSRSDGVGQ